MATHSSTLAWKIPWVEEPGSPWGHKESDTTERLHFSFPDFDGMHVCIFESSQLEGSYVGDLLEYHSVACTLRTLAEG